MKTKPVEKTRKRIEKKISYEVIAPQVIFEERLILNLKTNVFFITSGFRVHKNKHIFYIGDNTKNGRILPKSCVWSKKLNSRLTDNYLRFEVN